MAENNLTADVQGTSKVAQELIGGNDALQSATAFFNKYKNFIFIGLGIALIGVLAYMFLGKKEDAAKALKYEADLRTANYYMKQDSFDIALNGQQQFIGLLQVIKKAKGTTSAEIAKVYAAVCYIKKNDAKSALKQLDAVDDFGKQVDGRVTSLKGDANSILAFEGGKVNQKYLDEAVSYYKKAANEFPADLSGGVYLYKAMLALDKAEKLDDAKKIAETIQEKYAENKALMTDVNKYLGKYGILK